MDNDNINIQYLTWLLEINNENIDNFIYDLNKSFQETNYISIEDYQIYVVEINTILKLIKQDNPFHTEIEKVLKSHLKNALNDIYNLSNNSVYGTMWDLFNNILKLPGLKVDYFEHAKSQINTNISLGISNNEIIKQINYLINNIHHPCYYYTHNNDKERNEIIKNIKIIITSLKESSEEGGFNNTFIKPLEIIYNCFLQFNREYEYYSSNKEKQDLLLIRRPCLSGIGLSFFTLPCNIACEILSLNNKGQIEKKNKFGTHAVCRKENIFYKPNSTGRFFIGPEKEFAIYSLYNILNSYKSIAPCSLLKINNIYIQNKDNNNNNPIIVEKTLQASLGINGILLQDLIEIIELIPFLKSCVGENSYFNIFSHLINNNWEDNYINNHPELEYNKLEAINDIEKKAIPIILEFERIQGKLPSSKRCIEFIDIPMDNKAKRDIYANIDNNTSIVCIRILAILDIYPELCITTNNNNILEQVSFTKIANIIHAIDNIKKLFSYLQSPKDIRDEIENIYSLFSKSNFSSHVIASILTNPMDHKTDNFMVKIERNNNQHIESLSIIGIDNDLALTNNEKSIRSFIYLLPLMNNKLHSSFRNLLINKGAENIIMDWIICLENQNQKYNQWIKQGIIKHSDLYEEDGTNCLRIPLKVDSRLFSYVYDKLVKLIFYIKAHSSATHWDIFHHIQPDIANAYHDSLKEYGCSEKAYSRARVFYKIQDNNDDNNISNNDDDDELDTLIALDEAARIFLTDDNTFNISSFYEKYQVSVIGKILSIYPSIGNTIKLPGDPSNSKTRVNYFFNAIEQGYCSLVARLLEEETIFSFHNLISSSSSINNENFTLLKARNNAEQTALLLACSKLDYDMIKLLFIHYKADPTPIDIEKRNVITSVVNHFIKDPNKVISIIKLFALKSNEIIWNQNSGEGGYSILHYLIKLGDYFPEYSEPLIEFLISQGCSPDLLNKKQETPFDLAIKLKKKSIIKQFIHLGAGKIINIDNVTEYFNLQSNDNNNNTNMTKDEKIKYFNMLLSNSLYLRWNILLEYIKTFHDTNSKIILSNHFFGDIGLPKYFTDELFTKNGNIKSNNEYGRRNVNYITIHNDEYNNDEILFVKQYPEMAGVEYAVCKLFSILIGHGCSFSTLVRIDIKRSSKLSKLKGKERIKNKISYPLLLSQGIKGNNLHDILKNNEKTIDLEKNLDRCYFSELFLASLLVNYEDAKPDNFIIEEFKIFDKQLNRNITKYRLVCIDNDHAFVPPLKKDKDKTILVKSIIFCFNIMNEPIHPIAREKFISYDVDNILKIWLQSIIQTNEYYGSLFSVKERSLLKKSPSILSSSRNNHEGIYIPCPFRKGSIADIYQKFKQIQVLLRKQVHIKLIEIFRIIIPELAIRYEETFKIYHTPLERFLSLTQTQYSIAIAGRLETLVNSRQCLQHMKIELNKKDNNESEDYGNAKAALNELYSLKQERNTKNQKDIIHDIIENGNLDEFNNILLDSEKEKIISNINFNDISNINQQKKILTSFIEGGNYRTLTLNKCNIFHSNQFKDIVKYSPSLLSLKLYGGCSSILSKDINNSLHIFNHLTSLLLHDISNISGDINLCFPSLHHIKLIKLSQIEKLILPDSLTNIHLEDCFKLKEISIYHCNRVQNDNKTSSICINKDENNIFKCSKVYLQSLSNLLLYKVFSLYFNEKNKKTNKIIDSYNIKTSLCSLKFYNLPFYFTKTNLNVFISSIKQSYFNDNDINILLMCIYIYYNIIIYPNDSQDDIILNITSTYIGDIIFNGKYLSGITKLYIKYHYINIHQFISLISCVKDSLTYINLKNCKNITNESLKHFSEYCSNIKTIILSKCNLISNEGICYISEFCNKLSSIDLSYCILLTDEGIQYLSKCKNLTSINISYCELLTDNIFNNMSENILNLNIKGCKNITDNGIIHLSNICKKLLSLNISNCPLLSNESLYAITKYCTTITDFDISNNNLITDNGVQCIEVFKDLQSCNFSGCLLLSSDFMYSLSNSCSKITYINLYNCTKITSHVLYCIAKDFPDIEYINVSQCTNITGNEFSELNKGCKKIHSLLLSKCNSISSTISLSKFTNISYIDISYCYLISDLSNLSSCNNLTHLDISYCNKITNDSLEYIKNIQILNLSWCTEISDEGLNKFNGNLININLTGCRLITNEGIKYLCDNNRNLKIINISECNRISDESIKYLSQYCLNIKDINLTQCKLITDNSLNYISNNLINIKYINISDCTRITDNGLEYISQQCKDIKAINLSNCELISNIGIQYLIDYCPNISKIQLSWNNRITINSNKIEIIQEN